MMLTSYLRLKTQMTYVGHEEYQLEQKRQHCKYLHCERSLCRWHADTRTQDIKVVDAFKSALQLLEGN